MAAASSKRTVFIFAGFLLLLAFVVAVQARKTNEPTDQQQNEEDQSSKDNPENSKKKLPEFPNGVIKFNNPDLLKGLSGNARPASGTNRQGYTVVQAEFRSGVTTNLVAESRTLAKKYTQIIEDELGYTAMQKLLDSQSYQQSEQTLSDDYQAQRISMKIRTKFRKFQNVLNTNRRNLESLYKLHKASQVSHSIDCCTLPTTKHRYDSIFGTNISRDMACDISSMSTPPSAFIPTRNLTQAFKRQLLSNPTLKWQYFSSEKGVHMVYPATPFVATHQYADPCTVDMRSKSLYASTVRPTPMNVVLVIDRGSQISPVSLGIAQKAATIALGALARKDKVAVLSMGPDVVVSQPGSCYDDTLAPASAEVKGQLIQFINGIKGSDEPSNHTAALRKAFDLIQRTGLSQPANKTNPDSVILYISTGHAASQDEVKTSINIAISENRRVSNRVVIMTYALVEEGRTGLEELAFLRDLAEQDNGTYRATAGGQELPPVQMGVMTVLNQLSHLPSTVGIFYSVLPQQPNQAPISFSLPYMDSMGTGLIMSLTRPCYANDQVVGVIGLDVNMADVLEDVTYFEEGDRSYAFMIDNRGLTIMHPSLPKPSLVSEQPAFTSISHFEQSEGFEKLQAIMIKETSGNAILPVSVNSTEMAKYSWKHIDGTPFTVCTVILTQEKELLNLRHSNVPLGDSLMYHRLDLLPASNMCMHLKQLATLDGSSLFLSASSFASPYEHLSQEETKLVVQAYMAYLSDNTRLIANPGLKQTIKNDVAATRAIEKTWMKQILNSNINEYIVRRYVATTSGALWVYPGTLMSKTFDPARRPWYKRALENPGRITLTSPYLDNGGAGYIVTLSRVIFEGRSSGYHTEADNAVAVMGIDLTLAYFYQLLVETLPVCEEEHIRCFVMDERGYLVAHPYFVEPLGRGPMEKQHITHQEVLVSNDVLYHTEFVQKLRCNRIGNRTVQRYYAFNTSYSEGVVANKFHSEHCIQYKMTPVPFSNTFVGVVNETCDFVTAFCPCSMVDRLCLNCHRMEQEECECPCECTLDLDPCSGNILNADDDDNPSCPGMEENAGLPEVEEDFTEELPQCQDFQCDHRTTAGTCRGVMDCEWCEYDQDASSPLDDPFCATQRECFGGVIGAATPYGDEIVVVHRSYIFESNANAHVGPVAGALLGVILSLALVIYIYRHHITNQERRRREMAANGSDTSVRMTQGDADVVEGPEQERGSGSPENQPPPGAYAQGNIILAALHHPSPYHQRMRQGIRIWRRQGQAPSESDHGYSTMTPHEDSEYQYVEPEPVSTSPECRNIVDPPPGMIHVDRSRDAHGVTCRTALLEQDCTPPSCVNNPLGPSSVPKIDPPPQTVLPRRSHHMRTRAQVHSVDTTC